MSAEGTAKSLTVLIKKAKTYEVFINTLSFAAKALMAN